ncbi:hypothetical protein RE476_08320 [Methanolobus mangrovi]|uniref:Uncharacterized protein n=1 Tax=Methanolobus mangrovi TaxID=3072977 RepID=A0AA51YIT0_9EURY|nr:hypothetical protein [Methanolobus mangrovi]WMW21409.1 hypothetical protein RE476_08320 [Methanolobus mangrovi]
MEDMTDSLKQFIESRLQEATRAQALYPDRYYIASGLISKLTPEQMGRLSRISPFGDNMSISKKDFKW